MIPEQLGMRTDGQHTRRQQCPLDQETDGGAANAAPEAAASVRRVFEAIADREMTARKSRNGGKATVVELAELQRWLRSLPTRGRPPEDQAATAIAKAR
jgi:hypothetical protein